MTVAGAITLIWTAALLVAMLLTIAAVTMIIRIIYAARETDRLLKETLPSAVGIVNNTAAISELAVIVDAAGPLLESVARIKASTDAIRAKVARVGAMLLAGTVP